MELPEALKTFFEVMEKIKPGMESALAVGTTITTAGTGVVKVIQAGTRFVTLAVGKKKEKAEVPKKSSRRKKTALPQGLEFYDGKEKLVDKKDVVVVVEVSRRAVNDAVRYLEDQKIDANLIVVTNTVDYSASVKAIDENNPREWEEMVQEFNVAMDAIKHEAGAVKMHIFLATPVTLAFGLGAVWGTVDGATVYHWNSREYKPVLEISRALRFGKS